MTEEILEQRRSFKNRDPFQYNIINRRIRRKIKEAKEEHLKKSCREIEGLQEMHDDFHLHKEIK